MKAIKTLALALALCAGSVGAAHADPMVPTQRNRAAVSLYIQVKDCGADPAREMSEKRDTLNRVADEIGHETFMMAVTLARSTIVSFGTVQMWCSFHAGVYAALASELR